MQFVFHLNGTVDPARMRAAGQALLDRHANLRAAFVPGPDGRTLSVIRKTVELPWQDVDLTGLDTGERVAAFERVLEADRDSGFDHGRAPDAADGAGHGAGPSGTNSS